MSATRPGSCRTALAVAGLLEGRADARPQRLRLPDVEDLPRVVAEQVDARLRGKRLELFLHPVRHGHGYRSRAHDRHKGTARSVLGAALVLAPAAHAGGPGMVIGATEDESARRRSPRRRRRWTSSRSPASAASGSRRSGSRARPPSRAPTRPSSATSQRRPDSTVSIVLTTVMNFGSATTPLTDQDQSDFASYAASVLTAAPSLRTIIVGNEPNLNRYWLPQFNVDGSDAAAPAYEKPAREDLRRREGCRPGRRGARRRRLAARQRQPGAHASDPLADRIHPRPRHRVPRERADDADHGRIRLPSVRGRLERRAVERRASELDDDRARRLPEARRAARQGVRRNRPARLDAADRLRRVRRRDADPGGEAEPLHGHRACDDEAVAEATQAAYYRQAIQLAFCQPNVEALYLFHTFDETALEAGSPGSTTRTARRRRASRRSREAMDESRRGVVATCAGAHCGSSFIRPSSSTAPRSP